MIAEDRYLCELCHEFRRKEPRAYGDNWIDGFWACAFCIGAYRHKLAVTGGIHASLRT
jgi:hypothetical protein